MLTHRFTLAPALLLVVILSLCQWPIAAATAAEQQDTARLSARRTPVVEVFEASRDAVVNISCTEIVTVRDPFADLFQGFFDSPFGHRHGGPPLGGTRQYTRTSVGSGFVIHPDGYIITNAHVVAQTPERKVTFANGSEFDAQIVASDPQRDLAVLKIQADHPLPTLKLGRSDDLMIGETVIAIGNPLGYQNTVTAGVVSAVNRDLHFAQNMKLTNLIQTDASINPGNSGGPLLNVLGELIGVNTAIRGDAQNIGFAIPVDQLREVLPDLLDIERRYRIVCGLTVDTLNSPRITAVKPGTPAQEAGIKPDDVLRRIGDHAVTEGIDFYIALMSFEPGETVDLQLERNGQPFRTSLTLERRPAPDGNKLAMEKLGIAVEDLPPNVAASMGFPGARGLLVVQVQRGGPAAGALKRNDLLIAIGRHAVGNVDELGQLLEFVQPGQLLPFTVLRAEGWTKYRLQVELQAR